MSALSMRDPLVDPTRKSTDDMGLAQCICVERFIGSACRECFDHVIVFNETGPRLMIVYCSYYERSRTHLSLDKDAPIPRAVMPPSDGRSWQSRKSVGSTTGTRGAQPERPRLPNSSRTGVHAVLRATPHSSVGRRPSTHLTASPPVTRRNAPSAMRVDFLVGTAS
jgi:hypothetical protein